MPLVRRPQPRTVHEVHGVHVGCGPRDEAIGQYRVAVVLARAKFAVRAQGKDLVAGEPRWKPGRWLEGDGAEPIAPVGS